MIPLALVIFAFFVQILFGVISLSYERRVIHSVCLVGAFHITGVLIFVMPFVLAQLALQLQTTVSLVDIMGIWVLASVVLVAILLVWIIPFINQTFLDKSTTSATPSSTGKLDWASFKPLSCLSMFLFISTCSLLNFSFCLLSAITILPVYTLIAPTNNRVLRYCQILLLLVFSPVAVLFFLSIYLDCYGESNIGTGGLLSLLATLFEHFRLFSNLTYPFLCLVFIPTNLEFLYAIYTIH